MVNDPDGYSLRTAQRNEKILRLVDDVVIDETANAPQGIANIAGDALLSETGDEILMRIDPDGFFLTTDNGTYLYKLLNDRKEIYTLATVQIATFSYPPDNQTLLLTACLLGLVTGIARPSNFTLPQPNLNTAF